MKKKLNIKMKLQISNRLNTVMKTCNNWNVINIKYRKIIK